MPVQQTYGNDYWKAIWVL